MLKQEILHSSCYWYERWCQYRRWYFAVRKKSLVLEQSRAQKSLYIFYYLLAFSFFSSLQSYKKFFIKLVLKLFEINSFFKDNHMIISCILRHAQSRISVLALIDSEVFIYAFIDKFFAQHHNLSLHSLIYSRRFQDFNDQIALIKDIIHVVKIIMTLENHIKRLFLYIINLNQYLIIMSFSWLRRHEINASFKFNTLTMFSFFCLAHCCQISVKIHEVTWEEEFLSLKKFQRVWELEDQEILLNINQITSSHLVLTS